MIRVVAVLGTGLFVVVKVATMLGIGVVRVAGQRLRGRWQRDQRRLDSG